ncbi:MAG: hypothetical protein DLM70_16470 [Chloroflexi bacterium]|nr:MAG: hypothetical protein DLM70_16470 [Chloroflexota bacterium]
MSLRESSGILGTVSDMFFSSAPLKARTSCAGFQTFGGRSSGAEAVVDALFRSGRVDGLKAA